MQLRHLWLTDVRSYARTELEPSPELTVIRGDNGAGKTNLLEAIGYLATRSSLRNVTPGAMVRMGAERGVVRGEVEVSERDLVLEAEINLSGRDRFLVNRQPLRRSSDLADSFRVSVFTPDDLELVKGGPAGRRRWLDDVLVACHPRWRKAQRDLERILRQRSTLLKQVLGTRPERLSADVATTLEVWDDKLAHTGTAVARGRLELLDELGPRISEAYDDVAHAPVEVGVAYEATWPVDDLSGALAAARAAELRRGVCLVGPHRDDIELHLAGMPARTHASQGEQRSLALALRLAAHRLLTDRGGHPPVLLLDDVFSELDPSRSEALLGHLPAGQALLTTAGPLPPGARSDLEVRVVAGALRASP